MDLSILKYEVVNTNIMTAAAVEGAIGTAGDLAADTSILTSDVKVLDMDAICEKDKLNINAEVEFTVMCISDEGIYSLSARSCFNHSINVEGADENMSAKITAKCSDVDSRITTDNTIELKTLVEFNADIVKSMQKEIVSKNEDMDVETEVFETTYQEKAITSRGLNVIREDLKLPDSLPQIETVLYKNAFFIIKEVLVQQDSVYVVGDLQMCVVYKHENKAYMAKFNVAGEVIVSGEFNDDNNVTVKSYIREINLKIYEDDMGERKIIALECPAAVEVTEYIENTIEVISDAFSIEYEADVVKEDIVLPIISTKISVERCSIDAPVQINIQPSSIPMICANKTEVTSVAMGEGNALVSGSIEILTFDEMGKCQKGYVPFECALLYDYEDGKTFDITAQVICTEIDCYFNAENILCVKGAVSLNGECSGFKTWRLVTRIDSGEAYDDCERPLLLAIAQFDDNTWSIAKRCKVKVADLCELNPALEDGVKPGMVVIAIKK